MESLTNYQELWDRTRKDLIETYSESIYNELFKDSYVYKIIGSEIVVIVKTPYVETKIKRTYLPVINEILESKTIENLKFRFQTKESYERDSYEAQIPKQLYINNLDSNYTFDNFVVGNSNHLAYKMAMKVAETPGVLNPLYIFGDVGLGKTHLTEAIGNYISEVYPDSKVLYIQAMEFVTDYTSALKNGNMDSFHNKYNDLDVLLVDDIQMIAKAPKSQQEFFNLFNELYIKRKQMVITSDSPATKLPDIMDRLTSRFVSGMVVDITPPDLNQRLDILKKKIEERTTKAIANDALEFIAKNFTDNIRTLDGALTRVLQYDEIMFQSEIIKLEHVKEALGSLLQSKTDSKTQQIDNVLSIISDFYQITHSDLIGPNRNLKYVIPRQICMYILKNYYDLTYSKIGKILGKRDHSTIMSGANKIDNDMKVDSQLKSAIDAILSKLGNADKY